MDKNYESSEIICNVGAYIIRSDKLQIQKLIEVLCKKKDYYATPHKLESAQFQQPTKKYMNSHTRNM